MVYHQSVVKFLNFDKIKSIKLDYYNNKDEFIDLIPKLKIIKTIVIIFRLKV